MAGEEVSGDFNSNSLFTIYGKLKSISARNMFILFAIIFSAISFYSILLQPLEKAVAFSVIDDGMYYPKIAQTFVHTGVFSYDGETITNGFHPLWETVLIPIYYFIDDSYTALKIAFCLIFTFLLLSVLILIKIGIVLRFSFTAMLISFITIILNLRSITLFYSMLESPLILILYFLYMLYLLRVKDERFFNSKAAFTTGILLGLIFLGRLDSFFLAISYTIVMLIKMKKRDIDFLKMLKPLLLAGCGILLIILPYLILNYVFFSTIVTVSAYNKFEIPSLHTLLIPIENAKDLLIPRISYVFHLSETIVWIATLTVFIVFFIIITKWRNLIIGALKTFEEFSLFVGLHFLFTYFFVPGEALFSIWFYVPELMLVGLLLGTIVNNLSSKMQIGFLIIGLVFVISQFYFVEHFNQKKTMSYSKIEMAKFIKKHFDTNQFVGAMYDSGIVSYFSERKLFSLNGLISDFRVAELCKGKKYSKLSELYGIKYLIIDCPLDKISKLPGEIIYQTKIKTVFGDFRESEKPFVLMKLKPWEFDDCFKIRFQ